MPINDSILSAEGVALSLISKFSKKHLPKASDLKWLVSEQDLNTSSNHHHLINIFINDVQKK